MAAERCAGDAQLGANRMSTSHTTMMGSTASGASTTPRTGARQSSTSTPASIACASGAGIAATAFARPGHSPVSTTSAPVTINAPTAAGHPPSGTAPAASRAAPGVDHASTTGIRVRCASHSIPSACVRHSATSPDAAWVGVAPMA